MEIPEFTGLERSGESIRDVLNSSNTDLEKHPSASRLSDEDRFSIVLAKERSQSPSFQMLWRQMLLQSESCEKIYQSPEFFRYLADAAGLDGGPFEVFAVERTSDGKLVGIIPVRLVTQAIEFRIGSRIVCAPELFAVQLLGSAPMLSPEPDLMRKLMHHLLDYFPQARLISMQALSRPLYENYQRSHRLPSYVLNGWRACHTIPLPDNFEQYLHKFSAKKRYNLSRQVRLLAKEAGPVQVERIEQANQVARMFDAIAALVPPAVYEAYPEPGRFQWLAEHGLLHSYLIRAGDEPVAVVIGTHAVEVWHVHNIFSSRKYAHLSVGTSAVHLALEDVITHCALREADFGYGSPNQDFRSTHVLKTRGHVLLYRRFGAVGLLLAVHRLYDRTHSALVNWLKPLKKNLDERAALTKRERR
jgi:hypothetical protein